MRIPYSSILNDIKRASTVDEQTVQLVTTALTPCPTCEYDPISRGSKDSTCPTCGGEAFTYADTLKNVSGQVEYVTGLETAWERGGKLQQGQVILTLHVDNITAVGFTPSSFLTETPPVEYIVISGLRYTIVNATRGELLGEVYEIILVLGRDNVDRGGEPM